MKVLIIGNGGREHALLWKLKQDAPDAEFYITKGNGGTGGLARRGDSKANTSRPVMAYIEWGNQSHPHTMEFRRTCLLPSPYSAASLRIGLLG